MPRFESPVSRTTPDGTDAVLLFDMSSMTSLVVRSDIEQFGVGYGKSTTNGETLICGSRPGEWSIIGSADACAASALRISTGGFTSVIDYSHARALFRLAGVDAAATLEKVCSIDWSNDMTPDGAVVSASVAKVICDIVRNDTSDTPSYLIACDRSFGRYLFDTLADACSEFGSRTSSGIGDD